MNPLDPRHLHARNYLPLFDSTRFKTKTKNDKKKKKTRKNAKLHRETSCHCLVNNLTTHAQLSDTKATAYIGFAKISAHATLLNVTRFLNLTIKKC